MSTSPQSNYARTWCIIYIALGHRFSSYPHENMPALYSIGGYYDRTCEDSRHTKGT